MIYEYAIDPAVILKWADNARDYAEGIREYGLGTPRILSSFPKQKARRLRSSLLQLTPADEQSLHARRYVELVRALTDVAVERPIDNSAPSSWSEGVVSIINKGLSFDLVIAEDSKHIPSALKPSEIYRPNSLWNHPRQYCIGRTLFDFSQVASNLIKYATGQVVIVDPYAWNRGSIPVIQYLVKSLQSRLSSKEKISLTVLCKQNHKKDNPSSKVILKRILNGLTDIPDSIEIHVKELDVGTDTDIFHNRYLLTSLGGMILGAGVDLSEDTNHTDDVILMDKDLYTRRWNQYVSDMKYPVVSSDSTVSE